MVIELRAREEWHVRVFWERSRDPEVSYFFPSSTESLSEALALFTESLQEGATSYDRVIYYRGRYIGDIWCYCIQESTALVSLSLIKSAGGRVSLRQPQGCFYVKYSLDMV